ncbi:hypothetical protein LTR36_001102 [Oleoguttula mirabilis]|uniref:PNPLA domain-containing protein n=1 Tax=Oleoguttula mirabilis TaxID=1507867 RepID=A0AAV9JR45_9PEZI|nr:hypothetical protein LTR36_001102 [Oleoguttula mirabilis]
MAKSWRVRDFLKGLFDCISYITVFWWWRLVQRVTKKTDKQLLFENLHNARVYEEWEAAAIHLDCVLDNNFWRAAPASRAYDHRLISARTRQFEEALFHEDVLTMVHSLRSGLVRNLGNITAPKLYNRAYSGTKYLIEDYVSQVGAAVRRVTSAPTGHAHKLSSQQKLDVLHDARLALGRSCLVLQGGSIFGLCHVGVVKALHLRGLLPRIIAGTATGALMAALVCVHKDDELLERLSGEGIDLSAFAASSERAADANHGGGGRQHVRRWFSTLRRRAQRFFQYGYVLDVKVLEECVRANVGNKTFEEAYKHTKRVLNITVSATGGGVPTLLNYLTAPNVLIWSAALVSNASDARYSPTTLQCKKTDGSIVPWDIPMKSSVKPTKRYGRTPSTDHDRDTPLSRAAELFNVNHFIISQARPYIAPFLAPSLHHSSSPRSSREPWGTYFMRLLIMELQHRLTQMDMLGWLSPSLRRLLLDESVPGASWTLVPQVSWRDFARLLRNPTREEIDYWILRGERSVWPALSALRIRCAVEVEIDRGYQLVRRRKPFDMEPPAPEQSVTLAGDGQRKRKTRAASMGAE